MELLQGLDWTDASFLTVRVLGFLNELRQYSSDVADCALVRAYWEHLIRILICMAFMQPFTDEDVEDELGVDGGFRPWSVLAESKH